MTSVIPQNESVMEVLDRTGHAEIKWDKNVPAEVAMAQQAFDALADKKYFFHKVDAKGNREQIRAFDKNLERIVASPQLVGG